MSEALDFFQELPDPPRPTEHALANFRDSDWIELFFEWHKTVGLLAVSLAFLMPTSPAVKKIAKQPYLILTALLSRISRLMMANLRMASEDRHSEAIAIINRSIHETAVKLIWLCKSRDPSRFKRYLSDGLRNDSEFHKHILAAIERRGHRLPIEDRMLKSIERSFRTSRLSEEDLLGIKKLPTMESMMKEIGFADLAYIIVQRMGSHAVHGTWTELLAHTIDVQKAKITLRGEFNSPHPNQLMLASVLALEAMSAFCQFIIRKDHLSEIESVITAYRTSLLHHNSIMATFQDKSSKASI